MKTFIAISYHGETCGINATKEIDLPFAPNPLVGIVVAGGLMLHNEADRLYVEWHIEDDRFNVRWRPAPQLRPSAESVAEQLAAFKEDGWSISTWGEMPALEEVKSED